MMDASQIRKAVVPLKIIFWAWMGYAASKLVWRLCLTEKPIYLLAIFRQVLFYSYLPAFFLIGVMALWLSTIRVSKRYTEVLIFSGTAFILCVLWGSYLQLTLVARVFHYPRGPLPGLITGVLLIAWIPAMAFIGVAAVWLCDAWKLRISASKWRLARNLLFALNALPPIAVQIVYNIVMRMYGPEQFGMFQFRWEWLVVLVAAVPMIWFYLATRSMQREIESVAGKGKDAKDRGD